MGLEDIAKKIWGKMEKAGKDPEFIKSLDSAKRTAKDSISGILWKHPVNSVINFSKSAGKAMEKGFKGKTFEMATDLGSAGASETMRLLKNTALSGGKLAFSLVGTTFSYLKALLK